MGILAPCLAHTAGGQHEPWCRSLPYPLLPGLCLLLQEIPVRFNNASTKPPSCSFAITFMCSQVSPAITVWIYLHSTLQAAGWRRLQPCTASPCMGASLQPSVLATSSSDGAAAAPALGKELQRAWQAAQGRDPLQGVLQRGAWGVCHSMAECPWCPGVPA